MTKRVWLLVVVMLLAYEAPAHQAAQVAVRDVAHAPESALGRTIPLCGVLSVLKDDTTLWDAADQTSLDAYVVFAPGWATRSDRAAVARLERMRRRSKTSFPQKGVTAMVLGFRSADVVLEGRLIENPEYRVSSAGDNATPVVVGAAESRRATARYRFEVERVVRLRER